MAARRAPADAHDPMRGLLPERQPWRPRLRPWIVAPVLALVAAAGLCAEYVDRTWETLDEARERLAPMRLHETPLVLWATEDADRVRVALSAGGVAVAGTWTLANEQLCGTWPLAPAPGLAAFATWSRSLTGGEESIDGRVWREYLRPGVPGDLDRLGHDARLSGTWEFWSEDGKCGLGWMEELRPGGTCARLSWSVARRWSSDGHVLLLAPDEAQRGLEVVTLVACPGPAHEGDPDPTDGVPRVFRGFSRHHSREYTLLRPASTR